MGTNDGLGHTNPAITTRTSHAWFQLILAAALLRWREFQELTNKRIEDLFGGNAALAIGDVAHSISEALADDWQDREFYERYRH